MKVSLLSKTIVRKKYLLSYIFKFFFDEQKKSIIFKFFFSIIDFMY